MWNDGKTWYRVLDTHYLWCRSYFMVYGIHFWWLVVCFQSYYWDFISDLSLWQFLKFFLSLKFYIFIRIYLGVKFFGFSILELLCYFDSKTNQIFSSILRSSQNLTLNIVSLTFFLLCSCVIFMLVSCYLQYLKAYSYFLFLFSLCYLLSDFRDISSNFIFSSIQFSNYSWKLFRSVYFSFLTFSICSFTNFLSFFFWNFFSIVL